MINLFASRGSTATLMGKVDISLAEVLIFPQNKIQLTTKVMSIANECDHKESFCACDPLTSRPKHLGNITLWFRLTCALELLKSLFKNLEHWRSPVDVQNDYAIDHSEKSQKIEKSKVAHSEAQLVIEHTETEHILVSIMIECMKFDGAFESSENTHEEIYIEFNFLGNRRHKTDSKPLNSNEILFNFTQKYSHNERNLQRLNNILRESENSIKFIVVKKNQINNPQYETKYENIEVGFGLLHLGKLIYKWNGLSTKHTFEIPIISKQPPYQNIGYLTIAMEDIAVLKELQQKLNI